MFRVGHTVLHLDPNNYYGRDWAAFTLEGIQSWMDQQSEQELKVCLALDLDIPRLFFGPFEKNSRTKKLEPKNSGFWQNFKNPLKILTQIKRKIFGNSYGMAKNLNPN